MKKLKPILIVLLVIIAIFIIIFLGYFIYYNYKNTQEKPYNPDIKDTDNNNNVTDEFKEIDINIKNISTSYYRRYEKKDFYYDIIYNNNASDYTILKGNVSVQNNKAYLEYQGKKEALNISNVKKVLTAENCDNSTSLLVLTNDGDVYDGYMIHYDGETKNDKSLMDVVEFKKLPLTNVDDISAIRLNQNASTCIGLFDDTFFTYTKDNDEKLILEYNYKRDENGYAIEIVGVEEIPLKDYKFNYGYLKVSKDGDIYDESNNLLDFKMFRIITFVKDMTIDIAYFTDENNYLYVTGYNESAANIIFEPYKKLSSKKVSKIYYKEVQKKYDTDYILKIIYEDNTTETIKDIYGY